MQEVMTEQTVAVVANGASKGGHSRPEADIYLEGTRVPVQMDSLREVPAEVRILFGEPWDPIEKQAQPANRRDQTNPMFVFPNAPMFGNT